MRDEDFSTLAQLIWEEQETQCIPDSAEVQQWVSDLFRTLFPQGRESGALSSSSISDRLTGLFGRLTGLIEVSISEGGCSDTSRSPELVAQAATLSEHFFESLTAIFKLLLEDASALYEHDPAARSVGEVLASYPGFRATCYHRVAHQLYQAHIPFLPRIISEYAHQATGIDIHPGARIGARFVIDHGTGVFVGETAQIGVDVRIYQGVTLGALSVSKEKAQAKRHPTIEDRVVIYANSTILSNGTKRNLSILFH